MVHDSSPTLQVQGRGGRGLDLQLSCICCTQGFTNVRWGGQCIRRVMGHPSKTSGRMGELNQKWTTSDGGGGIGHIPDVHKKKTRDTVRTSLDGGGSKRTMFDRGAGVQKISFY